jgi:hypothetical protein
MEKRYVPEAKEFGAVKTETVFHSLPCYNVDDVSLPKPPQSLDRSLQSAGSRPWSSNYVMGSKHASRA